MKNKEINRKMDHYRMQLLDAGMHETTMKFDYPNHLYFYKPITALTAFILNMCKNESSIELSYGYASTAFTKFAGCENSLAERGVSDENITIREKIYIYDASQEQQAYIKIKEMYDRYFNVEKEELLAYAKEKRKGFLQQIGGKLKPLGFKKKGNSWKRVLESEYYVMFNAQKSAGN